LQDGAAVVKEKRMVIVELGGPVRQWEPVQFLQAYHNTFSFQ